MSSSLKYQSSFRKKRTRTLIQMGGLVEKSGLMEHLDIDSGDDLQEDFEASKKAATLLGALQTIVESLQNSEAPQQKLLWAQKGKEVFGGNKD